MKPQAAKSRKRAGKQAQPARLESMIVGDALRTWVVPTVAGVVAFVTYVLYSIEAVGPALAVSTIGLLALLILLFFGLRGFLEYVPGAGRLVFLVGFVVLWCAATAYPFYRAVDRGTPLFSAELVRNAAPTTVPLHDQPGHYSLVVEGHFLPAQGRETRTATYEIVLGHDGGTDRVLEGTFRQEWSNQRVGTGRRSFVVPVMNESNVAVDDVDDTAGHDLTMQLKSISAGARESVTVHIYPARLPAAALIVLGVLALAAALVVDAWRPAGSSGLMATLTGAALVGVAVFRGAGAATPGFAELMSGALAGAVGGALGGSLLWRLAQPLRKYVQ
jgi:hypothetical protein